MKKIKPILFSTMMVQALLAGRKTQTRRVIKPGTTAYQWLEEGFTPEYIAGEGNGALRSYNAGDVLWVRETWFYNDNVEDSYGYKADYNDENIYRLKGHFKPSIFMPKEACRIFLQVKSVKVERLHDIPEADAIAEGVQENTCEMPGTCPSSLCINGCIGKGEYFRYEKPMSFEGDPCNTAVESFETLWRMINGDESWKQNPWVWAIDFERCNKPEGQPVTNA